MTTANPAIAIHALRRVYQSGATPVVALDGLNLTIPVGQYVALKGRSGSGKTTLLNCLGGLDKPTSGSIQVLGQEIATLSRREIVTWRQQTVGFIFQSFGLLPMLSAWENVELMLRIAHVPRRERGKRATAYLEMVGLGRHRGNGRMNCPAGSSSGLPLPAPSPTSPR